MDARTRCTAGRRRRCTIDLTARHAPFALALALAAGTACAGASAGRFCDFRAALTVDQQDRLLAFAAVARRELEASGARAAIVARSGLDLARFGIRYTHAGIALAASPNGPWSVRQLYYACDEGRPRLFDQGMAGFVYGTDNPELGYLSLLVLPESAARSLERSALDTPRALALVGADYSANAYAWATRYQNCNQWLAELLALAWGDVAPRREAAQRWLDERGYIAAPVEVGSHWLMFVAAFLPWLHSDDHPQEDLFALRFRTSLPAGIEAFASALWPAAHRIELCHDGRRVVVRHGGPPMAGDCAPAPGDRVVEMDAPHPTRPPSAPPGPGAALH